MDHFKQAEEKLESYRWLKKRLKHYEEERDKAIRRSGPKGIAPIDLSNPAVKSSKMEDDFSAAEQIAYYRQKILETKDEMEAITSVVADLEPEQRKIIELWYFKKKSIEQIKSALFLSGTSAVYKRRNAAIRAFASIFPW